MDKDKQLKNFVLEALDWEPSINAAEIGVAVQNGVVTLSGHVATYAQKQAAERVVSQVCGVRALVLEIDVRPPTIGRPSDQDIAARAARVLEWDVEVPSSVTVSVTDGWITLHGEVDWPYERNAAARDVGYFDGVRGIVNQIHVRPRVQPADLRERIRKAFSSDAALEASGIDVEVDGSRVTLKGHVNAFRERRLAEETAWATPGVSYVEDQIIVT